MNKSISDFNQTLMKHFKKSKNSKISIGIYKNDEQHYYHFNKGSSDNDIIYGIGSISKTFIGSYLAKLIHEKKILLEDRINQYLPVDKKIKYPTIQQLATHTSGYSFFIPRGPTLKIMLFNGFNKKNLYTNIDSNWVYRYLNTHSPSKRHRYRYSDFNYLVLALIIEQIEGRLYKDIINDFVKNEIGLKNTGYYNLESSIASGYSWIWEDNNPFLASGGMYSTAADMIQFLRYQKDSSNEYLNISHQKEVKINPKNVFGSFSWCSFFSGSFYWHIGGQGYYRSYALFDKKRNLCVTILSTVDIDIQHVCRLGSSTYRNIKRNSNDFISHLNDLVVLTQ